MAEERMEVRLAIPERHYVKVYKDFLATKNLTVEEKMIYIALKSFVTYGQDEGEVFPSMENLCKLTSMSRSRATRTITSLIKKGVVTKKRRGLTQTNIYTLFDNPSMWAADSVEEMQNRAACNIPYSSEEMLQELKRRGAINIIESKKELTSVTDQSSDASTSFVSNSTVTNCTMDGNECQDQERYSMDDVRELFEYSVMIHDHKDKIGDIDAMMDILYDALNCTKKTIRVSGENKPTMVVIGKLMKLSHEEIIYSIRKYNERTGRINNPKSYMLTILYGAKEQMQLDMNNKVRHDVYGPTEDDETNDTE